MTEERDVSTSICSPAAIWHAVGVTSDLLKRIFEHKSKAVPGFTARYNVDMLVWFEAHASVEGAIQREKQIKEWRRGWKISLIEQDNPHWSNLYPSLSL